MPRSSMPRSAWASVIYERAGDGGSMELQGHMEGFTYTDPASGESDSVSITLDGFGMDPADGWEPQKGDIITADIILENWDGPGEGRTFPCGRFCLDDLTYKGPVLSCEINGTSVPEGNDFRSTARSRIWKNCTLKEIGAETAGRCGLAFSYEGDSGAGQ